MWGKRRGERKRKRNKELIKQCEHMDFNQAGERGKMIMKEFENWNIDHIVKILNYISSWGSVGECIIIKD